jgi:hypothetical protein
MLESEGFPAFDSALTRAELAGWALHYTYQLYGCEARDYEEMPRGDEWIGWLVREHHSPM